MAISGVQMSAPPDCEDSVYTSRYCEENIYWLVKRLSSLSKTEQKWDVFSVFISNPTKTVALWNQRMGPSKDAVIVWDYHVVCALRPRVHSQSPGCHLTDSERGSWIYDLDTHLPVPSPWKMYVEQTFPPGADMPVQYQSLFRVVPANVYLENFASDRSHMLDVALSNASEEPRYLSEPPPYPVICAPEAEKHNITHNLMTHFVSMTGDGQGFGTVMDFDAFTTWCSLSS